MDKSPLIGKPFSATFNIIAEDLPSGTHFPAPRLPIGISVRDHIMVIIAGKGGHANLKGLKLM
jgi:hypothetical protein